MENLSLDKLERYLENHCNNFNLISSAGELSTNHFPRYMLKELQSLVDDFLSGNTKIRWVIISGLRGVGKTTLLLQLYIWLLEQPNKPDRRPDVSFCHLIMSSDPLISPWMIAWTSYKEASLTKAGTTGKNRFFCWSMKSRRTRPGLPP